MLCCTDCGTCYPLVNGVPVLLNEENSVFRIADYTEQHAYQGASAYGGSLDRSSGLRQIYRRAIGSLTNNFIGRKKLTVPQAVARVREEHPNPRILVIGAADTDYGKEGVLYTDVAFGQNVDCICDAHDLPFEDGSFDMVIAVAVLEHVVDPFRCVGELQRVLSPDGYVYAATPFLQPVHMGAYDFTRFTYLGHRRLFRYFDDLESGTVGGPGNALAHVFRSALVSVTDRGMLRSVLRLVGLLAAVPLRYSDFLLDRHLSSYDAAWGTFFFGRKRTTPIPDREILTMYRGG